MTPKWQKTSKYLIIQGSLGERLILAWVHKICKVSLNHIVVAEIRKCLKQTSYLQWPVCVCVHVHVSNIGIQGNSSKWNLEKLNNKVPVGPSWYKLVNKTRYLPSCKRILSNAGNYSAPSTSPHSLGFNVADQLPSKNTNRKGGKTTWQGSNQVDAPLLVTTASSHSGTAGSFPGCWWSHLCGIALPKPQSTLEKITRRFPVEGRWAKC